MTGRLLLNSLALCAGNVPAFARAFRLYRPAVSSRASPQHSTISPCSSARRAWTMSASRASSRPARFSWPTSAGRSSRFSDCKVYDSYGHMERTVAVSECPEGGLHINPEYGILEMVERVPVAPQPRRGGATFTAKVVGTSLHNFSMPLAPLRGGRPRGIGGAGPGRAPAGGACRGSAESSGARRT